MQSYLSADGHGVKFTVVLSQPPYSKAALDSVAKIGDAVRFSLKNGPLEGAEFHISGSTAAVSEGRQITADDFIKVMIFVLLGIFVVLAILLRSLVAPWYLMLSVGLGFTASLGATVLVFQGLLGEQGLIFILPIYIYLFVVALGTDYNILMVARLREEAREGLEPRPAAAKAIAAQAE